MRLAVCLMLLAAPLQAQGMDSLLVQARRLARAWQAHDFGGVVTAGADVAIVLPGGQRSAPLAPAQAAEVLRGFAEGTQEETVEVTVVRTVDADRAYVELDRVFAPRGSASRQRQTIYLELRRGPAGFHVVEIRIVR